VRKEFEKLACPNLSECFTLVVRHENHLKRQCNDSTYQPLTSVAQLALTALPRTVGAAKYFGGAFHTVPNDTATTMIALRRHHVDRTFETIEGERFAVAFYLKRLVVVISAMCTFSHGIFSGSVFVARQSKSVAPTDNLTATFRDAQKYAVLFPHKYTRACAWNGLAIRYPAVKGRAFVWPRGSGSFERSDFDQLSNNNASALRREAKAVG